LFQTNSFHGLFHVFRGLMKFWKSEPAVSRIHLPHEVHCLFGFHLRADRLNWLPEGFGAGVASGVNKTRKEKTMHAVDARPIGVCTGLIISLPSYALVQ